MLNEKGWVLLRFLTVLFIQFVLFMLKITGAVSWDWVVVLIPLWVIIGWELITTILILWVFRKEVKGSNKQKGKTI